jgi:hypothetical protein
LCNDNNMILFNIQKNKSWTKARTWARTIVWTEIKARAWANIRAKINALAWAWAKNWSKAKASNRINS